MRKRSATLGIVSTAFVLALCGLVFTPGRAAAAAPTGEITWGVHVSLAPTWFDPAETPGIITPFMILYALHDAVVKPMPGNPLAPSLAESWSASPDGLAYDLILRKGVLFHNGDPVTAEDVKFSFERYRGAAAASLKKRVTAIDVLDTHHVRFRLKEPWPDFMTFYGTPATGAGWIVPKKYVLKVGEDGFKKAPIGAGPYRFVSFTPGVELVLEAFEQYWRKVPTVKRLVFKVIPDELTRLAALKRGEVDIVYSIRGELAAELRRTPGLTLRPTVIPAPFWLVFLDQWDAKSPWHDQRVRLAANYAIDRSAINQAETLGLLEGRLRASSRAVLTCSGRRRGTRSIPGKPNSFLPRQGTPEGLMPATTTATPRTRTSPKPRSTTSRRSASGWRSSPSSARPSSRNTAKRS